MKVWGLTREEIMLVVSVVSKSKYDGNVILEYVPKQLSERSKCFQVKLKCISGLRIGSRYNTASISGFGKPRRLPVCSWEVFRDIMEEMFKCGAKRIKSTIADYRSYDDFLSKYPATKYRNVGSIMFPVQLGSLTNHDFEEKKV